LLQEFRVQDLFYLLIEIAALLALCYGFATKGRWFMLLGGLLLLLGGPVHHHVRGFVVGGIHGALKR
jgi:hypothetical protein